MTQHDRMPLLQSSANYGILSIVIILLPISNEFCHALRFSTSCSIVFPSPSFLHFRMNSPLSSETMHQVISSPSFSPCLFPASHSIFAFRWLVSSKSPRNLDTSYCAACKALLRKSHQNSTSTPNSSCLLAFALCFQQIAAQQRK
jgi:hypothetical protein